MTYFSDVSLVEFEYVLGFLLERILATLGLDERVLGDLVLVAVERDEHFRICASSTHRSRLSRHYERCFCKANRNIDESVLAIEASLPRRVYFCSGQYRLWSLSTLASCWVRGRD